MDLGRSLLLFTVCFRKMLQSILWCNPKLSQMYKNGCTSETGREPNILRTSYVWPEELEYAGKNAPLVCLIVIRYP